MTYIKKMVLSGFKSFPVKTEIPFDRGINTIIGANGSGKSNIADALCFVLGRLSIKSMRAAKARNLLFMGSKNRKPVKEAYVEMVFDNCGKTFSIDSEEVSVKRVVRANGQSIYKINGETKTRMEILETLAQAGIDPHGFNLILQGQIQGIVKMHPIERRKIIENVAGISIYEIRKEKSVKELEKTEERLKEISTILRERTAFLRNLDKEREQALKYKELENTIRRCKASILKKNLEAKERELSGLIKSMEEKMNERSERKDKINETQTRIDLISREIQNINKKVQEATGTEQEKLHGEISDLKAELGGLRVRKEGYENRKREIERRIEEMEKTIPEIQEEIDELKKKSPLVAKKTEILKKKKEEREEIESERKKLLKEKSELDGLKERIRDRERQLEKINLESESVLKQIEEDSSGLKHRSEKDRLKFIKELKDKLSSKNQEIKELEASELLNEKIISVAESDISGAKKTKSDIESIDVCPLCQSKMTEEHKGHVISDSDKRILEAESNLKNSGKELEKIRDRKNILNEEIENIKEQIRNSELEAVKHISLKERKGYIKKYNDEINSLSEEIKSLELRRVGIEERVRDLSRVEERYDAKTLEIEEISSRTEKDVDNVLLYKEKELENTRNIIKRSREDIEGLEEDINEIGERIEEKEGSLEEKEEKEREMNVRFKKMYEQRDKIQSEMQELNLELSRIRNEMNQIDEQIVYMKTGKAQLDAQKETIEMELDEYKDDEIIVGSINVLEQRLERAKENISKIGSINMRALEVYEEVKKEYDAVQEKVDKIVEEKNRILEIIAEIDKKKKREFMKTFKEINGKFTENFSKLYSKGVAYLDFENKEDIFEGGVNIIVKLAKGKYFDITSLSGGEQTLVALSLLFAIQEHKPYHFYVLDEIDAALDKRNSERLAGLLNQYMKSGQYIVITHNDAIISNSNLLYGVSMQEGSSKILSLKL